MTKMSKMVYLYFCSVDRKEYLETFEFLNKLAENLQANLKKAGLYAGY